MKIAAASLAFSAQHSASTSQEVRESLRAWIDANRPDLQDTRQAAPPPSISLAAYAAHAQDQSGAQAINDAIDNANNDPFVQLLLSMLEMLTGRAIRIFSARAISPQPAPVELKNPQQAATQAQSQAPVRAGFGIEYSRHEIRTETEQTTFQAAGTVRTADGMEIGFRLDIAMQRKFVEESDIRLNAGDGRKQDPLVVNFGGTAAQLQSRRFQFDLAGNGQAENVPLFASNSGYLSLDLNGNGRVDSGKELFGAASGDGFADLAQHDSDGNGWIDESDPVFNRLRVWTPEQDGDGQLASLQDRQVGALFLGKQATPFELRDDTNRSLGAVRASGIYLAEDGAAGTLQQVDLTI